MITYEEVYFLESMKSVHENFDNLPLTMDDRVKERITNWCKKFDFPLSLAIYNYSIYEGFRFFWVIDPKKQDVAQIAFKNFITMIYGDGSIEQLDSSNNTSKYCFGGAVLDKSVVKNVESETKTIDFKMTDLTGRNIWIYHKRTSGNGGAQDNQFADVISFLKQASKSRDPMNVFIAVVDGTYYTKNKMLKLNHYQNDGLVYVYNSDTFVEEFLSKCMVKNIASE